MKLTDAAGFNTALNITTANNVTLYTGAAGTIIKGVAFAPVSGRGTVRSWTVVRESFLPGFDDDLPFVLVDVELNEEAIQRFRVS